LETDLRARVVIEARTQIRCLRFVFYFHSSGAGGSLLQGFRDHDSDVLTPMPKDIILER